MGEAETLFSAELKRATGITLAAPVTSKLFLFIKHLLVANQSVNLTAIKDYHEALFKHLLDALLILALPEFQAARTIVDIGSGAGIPAIPIAIAAPEKQVLSIEATRKKTEFQLEVLRELALENLQVHWERAEVVGQDPAYRGQFDLITARAVAEAGVLAELSLPLLKVNGNAVLYKGQGYLAEEPGLKRALEKLGGKYQRCISFELAEGWGERNLLLITKTAPTESRYPRKPGAPKKNPL
jgi:16S rRNA (guanine527-N7)-methyltransferase